MNAAPLPFRSPTPPSPSRNKVPIRAGEIHLWAISLQAGGDDYQFWLSVLSDDERRRADRYRFEDDRRRFVVARGLLRHLLEEYTGIGAARLDIATDTHGKPHLAQPHRPLHFNLAHSLDRALIAFSRDSAVGVDFEDLGHRQRVVEVEDSICTPAEKTAIASLGDDEARSLALLRLWSAKEAFLKALGTGLQVDPTAIAVSESVWKGSASPASVRWEGSPGISARYALHPLPDCEDWLGGSAAVAAMKLAVPHRLVWMDLASEVSAAA